MVFPVFNRHGHAKGREKAIAILVEASEGFSELLDLILVRLMLCKRGGDVAG